MDLPRPKEEKIEQTIAGSKRAFYEAMEERTGSWFEFLFTQARYIQKRWWVLQFLVLLALWCNLYFVEQNTRLQKSASVLIPLFGILLIPELWKNLRNHSIEVENTSYFTMRQIYAARLTLFAMADLLLVTAFLAVSALTVRLTLMDAVIQFLLPLNVTVCICLRILCSKRINSEYMALFLCMLWGGVWWKILMDERIYGAISGAVWLLLLACSLGYLGLTVKRLLNNCCEEEEGMLFWN
ncbi:MAG: hypothetical protein Q4F41_17815 [Eubacteriales bacterium]|nr:hypothetical protein [Eubacteriales bacterium]